jgi:hypothetical protein
MIDKIAIRKQLDFDRSADKLVGYVDMGSLQMTWLACQLPKRHL